VEESDTRGGLVFDLFGRLPPTGAKVSYMRYTFTVEKMLGTRIVELRIESHPRDAARPEAEAPESQPRIEEQGEE
jgi:CBS domain containing-hemolysin-like protein